MTYSTPKSLTPERPGNPKDFGVPHPSFRKAQWDAIVKATQVLSDPGKKFIFAEAPTGVGKSAIATALGRYEKVTVLVSTLNLLDQYKREYGFAGVKGRQNYPCVLPEKVEKWKAVGEEPTAFDCHFSKMWECPSSGECPYLLEKTLAARARRTVVTYAYGSLSQTIRQRPGILVMDEGHGAADHILDYASFTISESMRKKYKLPEYPSELWMYGEGGKGAVLKGNSVTYAKNYLYDCQEDIAQQMAFLSKTSKDYAKLLKVFNRIGKAASNLSESTWFLEAHPLVSKRRSGSGWRPAPGFRLRALDARIASKKLWSNKEMVLVMSATIGNPKPLADKMGISLKKTEHHVYSHPVPLEKRPVFDLGVKRMTYSNLRKYPNLYRVQAAAIADFVNSMPKEWRGIILTASYKKIRELSAGLQDFVTDRRIITQQSGMRIDHLTEQFMEDRKPGDVMVCSIQGFGEGIDLRGDIARFAVVAGTPFDNPTDPYIRAMRGMAGGQKYLLAKTYSAVPQACGRVTRATTEDGEWLFNAAAVADGSATTKAAMRYYPEFFRDALKHSGKNYKDIGERF